MKGRAAANNQAPIPSPVLTLAEVAELLRVHPSTIYRLIRAWKVPAFRMGGEYRFNRESIERWRIQRERDGRA